MPQISPCGIAEKPTSLSSNLRKSAPCLCYDLYQDLEDTPMSQVAKLFINGRSQAVRLPAAFRFDSKEVFIRQDPETGDVILSRKPATWDDFFSALKGINIPDDFLDESERNKASQERDPFAEWNE